MGSATGSTVAKVAKHLQAGNLLATRRGASGGYVLQGQPEDISLVTIIEVVEGPIAVNGCVDGAQDPCSVANCCFMSNQWNKVNSAIRSTLNDITRQKPSSWWLPLMCERFEIAHLQTVPHGFWIVTEPKLAR